MATLQSQLSSLQSTVSGVQGTVSDVQGTLSSVQSATKALSTTFNGVTRTTDVDGYATLQFSGMNVQVVNGTGEEYDDNGLGNLIVGYNDNDSDFPRTGSHNLVTGDDSGWSSYGGLIAGEGNESTDYYASVTGGYNNIASGAEAVVSGGGSNRATAENAAVLGGADDTVSGLAASVAGGFDNIANLGNASVTGGDDNTAHGSLSWIGGGYEQTVTADCQGVPTVPVGAC